MRKPNIGLKDSRPPPVPALYFFIRIRNRPGGTNLTLERHGINLWWQGYSGMRLNHLKSKLRTLSSLEDTPDVIVSHARLMIEDPKIQTEVFPEIFDEI
jgi:hypothetical protein